VKIFSVVASIAVVSLAVSEPAFAKKKRKHVFSHPSADATQRSADSKKCDVQARDAKSDLRVRYYTDPNAGLGSKAASSFGAGVAQGYMQRKEEFKYIEYCLAEIGYKKSWLTDDEMAHYKTLKKKARWAYLDELTLQERPLETLIDPYAK